MEDKKKEGLLPKMIREWKFKRNFTKEELKEYRKIKKEAFMKEMRKRAEKEGTELAKEEEL